MTVDGGAGVGVRGGGRKEQITATRASTELSRGWRVQGRACEWCGVGFWAGAHSQNAVIEARTGKKHDAEVSCRSADDRP